MTITALRRWRGPLGNLRLGRERQDATQMAAQLRVVPSNVSMTQGALSGGNQQKVLFGRCLFDEADVLVACDPTRGLDVRTRREMYARIKELKLQNLAVLVLSSDAEDILELCDRVAIVNDGKVGPLERIESLTVTDLEQMV
jgi:ribose transport system ATP-binding protein